VIGVGIRGAKKLVVTITGDNGVVAETLIVDRLERLTLRLPHEGDVLRNALLRAAGSDGEVDVLILPRTAR